MKNSKPQYGMNMREFIQFAKRETHACNPEYELKNKYYQQKTELKFNSEYSIHESFKPKIIIDTNIFIRAATDSPKLAKLITKLQRKYCIIVPEVITRELRRYQEITSAKLISLIPPNAIMIEDHLDFYKIIADKNIKIHTPDNLILAVAIKENAKILSLDITLWEESLYFGVDVECPFNYVESKSKWSR